MNTEEEAKAYEMAIEAARKELGVDRKEWKVVQQVLFNIFPELSEDEMSRRWILAFLCDGLRKADPQFKEQFKTAIAYIEKQKESLHISKTCKENADSFTDEDKRVREELVAFFKEMQYSAWHEKYWHDIEIAHILAYLEKQKEQKPNIELIQRSWYMEGYHDREFGKEPKWVIKTGEGGPKHELNPRYGQPLTEQRPTDTNIPEQKPAEWGFKGRRGRIGDTPEHIRKKAENFLSKFEPPYDADDICSAYETGAMESIKLHDRVPDLSDGYLLEELRRRGYKGKLAKVQEVEI